MARRAGCRPSERPTSVGAQAVANQFAAVGKLLVAAIGLAVERAVWRELERVTAVHRQVSVDGCRQRDDGCVGFDVALS
jgi:hypothetical protein